MNSNHELTSQCIECGEVVMRYNLGKYFYHTDAHLTNCSIRKLEEEKENEKS